MKNESYAARLQRGFAGELEAERDALKADAARYRFLRNTHSWETAIWEALDMGEDSDYGLALDQSVDAAMVVQS